MPMDRSDEYGIATVELMAGVINEHILSCETSSTCEGCCPICCAPCHALSWLRDRANENVTYWLKLWSPGGGWDWQNDDGSVDWSMIESHWKMTECHGE